MLGTKTRLFAPLTNLSLEDLVPADHFYRRLDRMLDLSFVRELVAPFYVKLPRFGGSSHEMRNEP
jgi:hypothetical protein